jgi:RimJ/RimL family protein N-acetyltransferase
VVGLTNINQLFKTANVWVVLGDRAQSGHGYASRATSKMMTLGFQELGLHAINTWIVEHNPSIHVARKVGFKPFGRQRQCHVIDGRAYDRLWFDVLASEHQEIPDVRQQQTA